MRTMQSVTFRLRTDRTKLMNDIGPDYVDSLCLKSKTSTGTGKTYLSVEYVRHFLGRMADICWRLTFTVKPERNKTGVQIRFYELLE